MNSRVFTGGKFPHRSTHGKTNRATRVAFRQTPQGGCRPVGSRRGVGMLVGDVRSGGGIKARTIQSHPIHDFRRRVDIGVEIWQSAAGFDGKPYRQWPVAGSVGCLRATREAYQMTLKISSTTIKFGGGGCAPHEGRLGCQRARVPSGRSIWHVCARLIIPLSSSGASKHRFIPLTLG